MAAASGAPGMGAGLLGRAVAASVLYSGLALWGLRWASGRLRARAAGATATQGRRRRAPAHFRVRPLAPWLGVLVKDLRLVFRSPSEMSMFLMPAAATVPMAISVAMKGAGSPLVAMGIMGGVAFFSLLAMPALLSVEVEASSYTRSLPLKTRWILGAKSAVTTAMYVTSMLIMVVVALLVRQAHPGVFLAFGVSGTFAAAAGALVLAMLLQRHRGRGTRRLSPYSAPLAHVQATLVGGLVVFLPVLAAAAAFLLGPGLSGPDLAQGSGSVLGSSPVPWSGSMSWSGPVAWSGALFVHLGVGILEAIGALLYLLTRP